MSYEYVILLCLAVLIIGFLYSSVGHAGASGYIAVMSLLSIEPAIIKPTALLLNIFVASITAWRFYADGHFSWRLFWPFAMLSVPAAFLGGYIELPVPYFKLLIGGILLYSAYRFLVNPQATADVSPPRIAVAAPIGGFIGFLAALTGTGGGIFLTPLLLFKRWAEAKTAAAVSALFIFVNSVSGLLGNWQGAGHISSLGFIMALFAIVGGSFGSYYGSRRFDPIVIKRILAVVLVIAGGKLILT